MLYALLAVLLLVLVAVVATELSDDARTRVSGITIER